jgi:hypothetical protein
MNGRLSIFRHLKIQEDPEALFQEGWLMCDVDNHDTGLGFLQRAIEKHYWAVSTLHQSRQFDALRSDPAFHAIVRAAEAGRERALAVYQQAGGERLLGI